MIVEDPGCNCNGSGIMGLQLRPELTAMIAVKLVFPALFWPICRGPKKNFSDFLGCPKPLESLDLWKMKTPIKPENASTHAKTS